MELKQYQKRALSDLDIFMGHLRDLKNIPGAYIQTWLENGITVGGDGMPPYQDTIPRVPHVCFKVPTGGGKTEAFLGTVILSAFYDRFIGKNYGVNTIIKYPLRLLSIQQLERTLEVILRANKVLKEDDEIE